MTRPFPHTTMHRRGAVRTLGAACIGLAAAVGRGDMGLGAPSRDIARRPNVVLIVLDDMRLDDLSAMPNVQTLLSGKGLTFSSFLATAPGCGPARASILTGKYPHNHGVLKGNNALGGLDVFIKRGNEQETIAAMLQAAGYRTALIGKYLNGYREAMSETYVPPGWSEWSGVTKEGYSRFEVNHNGVMEKYRSGTGEQYSTDIFATLLHDFVTESVTAGQPFFAYVAPRAPHGPAEVATRHRSSLNDGLPLRTPGFNEADVSDKPAWVRALPVLDAEDVAALDSYRRARRQTLLAVDELVAGLVATLDAVGALDDTYIILTSDNGLHLGEHRIQREKGSPYEASIRMPLVMRGPGIPAGITVDALASQIDLAPTIADWAGVAIPRSIDGRSLVPAILGSGAGKDWREAVLIEYHADRPAQSMEQPAFFALHSGTVVYVEYGTGEREFYDLTSDPYQIENRIRDMDPAQVDALSSQLAAICRCAGEECHSRRGRQRSRA